MTRIALLSTAFFLLITASQLFAGSGYKLYHSQDSIDVYGKWKSEKPFGKGAFVLCLKVVNHTSHAVSVSFEVNFYDVATIAETNAQENLCIPAGKALKGRKHGLCLVSDDLSNEQLLDQSFHWKIESLEKTNATDCD